MQKIVFEDTTVVKSPYVIIDGVEHEVYNGTYQGGTDLNAQTFNQMQDNIESAIDSIANLICPVGKVEVFFDNQDHSNYLGFTWERTSIGRVPVGIDENDEDFDTIGNIGGEKTHTLTVDEIPSHRHEGLNWIGNENYPISLNTGSVSSGYQLNYNSTANPKSQGSIITENSGGGQPHNIMQPYEVMAFWKRVS